MAPDSGDGLATPKGGIGCLLTGAAFTLLPTAMGLFLLYVAILQPLQRAAGAIEWVATPCTILSSEVVEEQISGTSGRGETRTSTSSTVYRAAIRYEYEFGGRRYESDQYDFNDTVDGSQDWQREAVESLPPGTRTECFVDPDRPDQAVLRRDSRVNYWAVVLVLPLFVVGAAAFYVTMGALRPGSPDDVER